MGLGFGYKKRERRWSIWKNDPALEAVSEEALTAWRKDGDASHLRPFVKPGQTPSEIIFRSLTTDQKARVQLLLEQRRDDTTEAFAACYHLAFRLGVELPAVPSQIPDADGVLHDKMTNERGLALLAEEVLDWYDDSWPGLTLFYGALIFWASFASDAEKKALSLPSTPTPSSEAGSIAAATEPRPAVAAQADA